MAAIKDVVGVLALLSVVAIGAAQDSAEPDLTSITETELKENVRFISHRNFTGRGTLHDDYELTSLFLERELREYGFKPLTFGKETSYFQNFTFRTNEIETNPGWQELKSRNVLGYIEGGEKKEEVVIIGAHYDHVGFGDYDSNNGVEGRGKIHHGADDNASGTSAVLEIAEALGELARKGVKFRRSVIVGFWGAEELGLIGSKHFVKNPPQHLKLENVAVYINLDMVGRNNDAILMINGISTDLDRKVNCPEVYDLTKKLNEKHALGFNIAFQGQTMGTDSWSFYEVEHSGGNIVSFAYFTGFHADYHRFSDTWEKINYPKLTRVAKLALLTLWGISEMTEKPRYK